MGTNYSWDDNYDVPQLALERNGSNSLIRRYLDGLLGPVGLTAGTSGTYYLHHDALGNVSDVTSSSGVAQWSYTYEPFGSSRSASKLVSTAPANPVRFDGQYLDSNTGGYALRARWYDPKTGRFASSDPLAPTIADPYVSAYVYADDRPTVLEDPLGLTPGALGKVILITTGDPAGFVEDKVDPNSGPLQYGFTMFESFRDQMLFGAGRWLRQEVDAQDTIDECSSAYKNKGVEFTAFAVSMVVGDGEVFGIAKGAEELPRLAEGAEGLVEPGVSNAEQLKEGLSIRLRPNNSDPAARRVTLRKSTKDAIKANSPKTSSGDFIDPNTGEAIPKEGPFDYGHKPGYEWWRTQQRSRAEGWTREQVIEHENDPSHYQIENPASNRSHRYEEPR